MSKRITVFMLLTLTILLNLNLNLTAQNQPKAWYVYKNANGLNNGTSWTNAWTSFSNINWNLMSDGDTVYISGGSDSLVYYEAIGSVGRSNITITKGKSSGHNGRVIIKAPTAGSGTAVQVLGKSNVKISKLEFHDWKSNIYLNGVINKFYLDSNKIINSYGGFVTTGGGVDTTAPKRNIWITNNYITTATWSTDQCEFSWYGTKNVYMIGNVIINSNNNPTPHDDFVQGDGATNSYFINNYWQFTPNVEKEGNANGLSGISNHGGDWVAVNNVFVKNNWQINGNINHFYRPNLSPTVYYRNWAKVLVANNTSIMYTGRHFVVDYDSQAVIKNNLLWIPDEFHNGSSAGLFYFMQSDLADDPDHSVNNYVIRNNVMIDNSSYANSRSYLGGLNVPPMHSSNQFIQDPTDAVTPGFVDFFYGNTNPQQFQLTSSSICRDAGESNITFTMHPDNDPDALNYLGSGENIVNYYLKRDFNKRLRDSNWDVGAFEYVGNQVNQDNDPPEVVSAELIDSITVNITFSEPMEQSSVTNPVNYSIDNGIIVNSAQSLSAQTVRLNTSVHSPGFYTVTVNNVTDTAGNIISAQQNSIVYGYNPDPLLELKLIPNNSLASAISDTPYVPQKTFDGLIYNSGDPTSRWAASGLPQWIVYDLGDAKMLNKTRIQYYNWNQGRIYNYSIQVSTDSVNWTYVKQNVSSTNTEWTEEVFEPTPARYVKIIVHSNNQNNWASLWEAEFYGNLIISGNDDLTNVPKEFKLEQNYPNPFNPTTKIKYSIPRSTEYYSVQQKVTLKVYDILGNEIATLVDDYKSAGNYEVDFNASDIASGVYIYRLFVQDLQAKDEKNGVYTESKKMLLMR